MPVSAAGTTFASPVTMLPALSLPTEKEVGTRVASVAGDAGETMHYAWMNRQGGNVIVLQRYSVNSALVMTYCTTAVSHTIGWLKSRLTCCCILMPLVMFNHINIHAV